MAQQGNSYGDAFTPLTGLPPQSYSNTPQSYSGVAAGNQQNPFSTESQNASHGGPPATYANPNGGTGGSTGGGGTTNWPASTPPASTPPPTGNGGGAAPPQTQAQPQTQSAQYQQVVKMYQQYLGRTPSYAEVQGQLQGFSAQGMSWPHLQDVMASIQHSREAQQYAATQQANGGTTGGTTTTPPPTTTTPPPMTGPLAGWDAGKWGDTSKHDPKYDAGHIMSQYAPSIENAGKVATEIAKLYPGTSFNGKDTINIPGYGDIDILTNSGSGQGMTWWWGANGGQPQQGAGGNTGINGGNDMQWLLDIIHSFGGGGTQQAATTQQAAAGPTAAQFAALQEQVRQYQTQIQELQNAGNSRGSNPNTTYY